MSRLNLKKHFNIIAVFLLAVILVMPMGACLSKSDDNKKFVVGFDAGFPPYGYRDDNGEYVGFDLDLAEEVCSRRGWELVKQPINWDSKDMELSARTIDCIWNGFTMSDDRINSYTWTEPYIDNSQVFVVEKDSGIRSFEDLEGKIVAVQAASSALDALRADDCKELLSSFKNLEEVPEYNTAFMNLEARSVDAIALDVGLAKYQLKNRGEGFVILDRPILNEKYGVAFLKGNDALRDRVQETLYEMLGDGTLNKIAEKWELSENIILGTDSKSPEGVIPSSKGINFWEILTQMASGMFETLKIFFVTLILTLPLGLVIAFGSMSRFRLLRYIIHFYIAIMRGTPLMLQLLVIYFGPYYLFGAELSLEYRLAAVIIGFVLNYAAYFAEIYRSGIESMPVGQYEAAKILGYDRVQTFFMVIFPQVIKRILPSITNEVITLVKDTSLAFSIAYVEVFSIAKSIAAAQTTMIPFVIAGVFYFIFNFVVAACMSRIERGLSYYDIK